MRNGKKKKIPQWGEKLGERGKRNHFPHFEQNIMGHLVNVSAKSSVIDQASRYIAQGQ